MRLLVTENHVKKLVREWFAARLGWRFSPIQTGMGEHGIHDSVGGVPVVVTSEMVGKVVNLAVTVEAKRPGRRGEKDRGMSKHQVLFKKRVRAAGGLSICCDGEDDLRELDRMIWELRCGRGTKPPV